MKHLREAMQSGWGAANVHPEGGTQGDEDKFFVLMTKGVTVVSSHTHTHLPLPFLLPRRRNSQEAGKGVLLLKCLCQGEEEDERGRGISWALAAQDSPSFSLHHIEMETSLHPQLRNAHQGGEKGKEKPRWVFSLQRRAAPPPGAEEKASSLEIRGSKRWPRLARRQGRMASELARRQPGLQECPPGGDRPHGAPRRGAPRSASPAPVTSAPSPPGQSPPPPRSRWGLKIKTPTAGSKWRRRLGERGGRDAGQRGRLPPCRGTHLPPAPHGRSPPGGRGRWHHTAGERQLCRCPLLRQPRRRQRPAAVPVLLKPHGEHRAHAASPRPAGRAASASRHHHRPPAGAPLRYASPRLASPHPSPAAPPAPAARRLAQPAPAAPLAPPRALRSPLAVAPCQSPAGERGDPRATERGRYWGKTELAGPLPPPPTQSFFWLVAAPEEAGLLLRRSYWIGECGRLSARKRPAIGGDAS